MSGLFRQPWLWAPLVLVVDFATKRLVLANEAALRAKIHVLGEFLRFIYVRNPGSAMGLFPVGRTVLVAVSLAAAVYAPLSSRQLRCRCGLLPTAAQSGSMYWSAHWA